MVRLDQPAERRSGMIRELPSAVAAAVGACQGEPWRTWVEEIATVIGADNQNGPKQREETDPRWVGEDLDPAGLSGDAPTAVTPLGAATLWMRFLRDPQRHRQELDVLAVQPGRWGDYQTVSAIMRRLTLADLPVTVSGRADDVAYVRYEAGDIDWFLTTVRGVDGSWRVEELTELRRPRDKGGDSGDPASVDEGTPDEPVSERLARATQEIEQLEQQLKDGLEGRTIIGQAEGILMERFDIDADGAFALLMRLSSTNNRKVRDLAEEIVRTRRLPAETTPDHQ